MGMGTGWPTGWGCEKSEARSHMQKNQSMLKGVGIPLL